MNIYHHVRSRRLMSGLLASGLAFNVGMSFMAQKNLQASSADHVWRIK